MYTADRNSWIMTCSCIKRMSRLLKDLPMDSLKKVGIKNQHSYTVIDVREIITDNDEIELMVFLRNPTGNFFLKDDEVWKGEYSQLSEKWTDNIREQLNYHVTEEDIKKAKQKHMKILRKWVKKGGKVKAKKVNMDEDNAMEDGEDDADEGEDGGEEGQEELTPMEGGQILELEGIEYVEQVENERQIKREKSRLESRKRNKNAK